MASSQRDKNPSIGRKEYLELKFTSDNCELEGKIKLRYDCELDLDLNFLNFIQLWPNDCENKLKNYISCGKVVTQVQISFGRLSDLDSLYAAQKKNALFSKFKLSVYEVKSLAETCEILN